MNNFLVQNSTGGKWINFIVPVLIFIPLLFSGCEENSAQDQKTPEITNPVLPGDRPDPTIIKIDDTYWASATSNEWAPLFPIFKSKDMVNWELETYVFPDGAPDWAYKNFWAPELSYDEEQDKVYTYYTARDEESDRLSVGVASADSPEGPYEDHGPLVAQEVGSIDAYEARDKDGTLYMLWKEDGNSQGEQTPMWAQEITEDRTELVGEKHELFRNEEKWEKNLVEGISIFEKNDYFYATYSAGSCCDVQCNYTTGVARSESLLGPWEKYDENPVLSDNEDWKCTGHGSVVEHDNGEFYFLYHAYSEDGDVFVGREAVLERIEWTDDGWPTFGNDAEYSREREAWNFSDNFESGLDPLWQWRVTHDIDYETGSEGLKVRASTENEGLGTLLVQPTSSPDYEMTATVDLEQTEGSAEGGIALIGAADNSFGAPVAGMGISAGDNAIRVWKIVKEETEILEEIPVDSKKQVNLKIEVSDGHLLDFSFEENGSWNTLSEEVDASALVPWGMGFRLGMTAKGDSSNYVNIKEINLNNY